MGENEKGATEQEAINEVLAKRAKFEELKASTEAVEKEAHQQLRRSLELSASFYEKLIALNAGTIALAVSVGVALLGKAAPHSWLLRANLNWLVAVAFFLWSSLISAFGHNLLFIKIARLESEKAEEWSRWIALLNANSMHAVTGNINSESANVLHKHMIDTFHGRIKKSALNLHQTQQSILRAKVLGYLAVGAFLIAYTLVFVCIVRIRGVAS